MPLVSGSALLVAGVAALSVGGAHAAAHKRAGEEWAYEEAGVTTAGTTTVAVTFFGVLLLFTLSDASAADLAPSSTSLPVAAVGVVAAVGAMVVVNRLTPDS